MSGLGSVVEVVVLFLHFPRLRRATRSNFDVYGILHRLWLFSTFPALQELFELFPRVHLSMDAFQPKMFHAGLGQISR